MMRPIVKLIVHHPTQLWIALLVLCLFYGYARVLLLQNAIGTLQYWIHRYPKNFPHGFFLPFFYSSVTVAFFAGIYHDVVALHSGSWKYVVPLPITIQGRLYRIIGVPLYAFVIGVVEAIQVFWNPYMTSDLSRLAAYFQLLQDQAFVDDTKLRSMIMDIKWGAWTLKTRDPTTFAYVRLPFEVLLAFGVCLIYGISLFCKEPRHDGEEIREATRNNDIARVRTILGRGVRPGAGGSDGSTALHICAQQAMVSIAKILLEHGADPNATDRLGFTPLHWAVQMRREEVSPANRLEIIRLLLNAGADVNKGDTNGRTAMNIARKKENSPALEVLQEVIEATTVGDAEPATISETQ
ncbi:hypothetical protein Poli38472_000726 [Pythium oligandrum]|uniref:Uncharacterized protein n=1 Tax=Pythium oligandrum TaxID=41045 RepID=A0A8K1CC63_PYTOL|nr:hypothetical protein Poli38472_000726 [Pythium oligandrum]|eukprot:TMW60684.1 hypothetical protein Poli38472_000726 [Pythium oligandrum]